MVHGHIVTEVLAVVHMHSLCCVKDSKDGQIGCLWLTPKYVNTRRKLSKVDISTDYVVE